MPPRGRGGPGRRYWTGGGRGNPYPYCRFYPWLPRRWWAYPSYGYPYAGYRQPAYWDAQAWGGAISPRFPGASPGWY